MIDFANLDAGAVVDAINAAWDLVTNWWLWSVCTMLYIWAAGALWRIAKRRGIANYWLAIFPVGNLWILGSIADHYCSLKGQNKNRRKVLQILGVAALVLTVATVILMVCGTVDVLNQAPSVKVPPEQLQQMENMSKDEQLTFVMELMIKSITSDPELVAYVQGCATVSIVMAACLLLLTLAGMVVCRIAAYDVLCSCDPYQTTLLMVLSCVIPPALPVALFLVDRKDMGLPQSQGKKK